RLGRLEEAAEWAVKAASRPNAHPHILGIAAFSLALAGSLEQARAWAAAPRASRLRHRGLPQGLPVRCERGGALPQRRQAPGHGLTSQARPAPVSRFSPSPITAGSPAILDTPRAGSAGSGRLSAIAVRAPVGLIARRAKTA